MSEVLEALRELQPILRERAQEAEDRRVLSAESIKSVTESGFFRLLQPKTCGGLEADPMDFYTGVRIISSACGSTGWVSSVVGVHPWQLALFPAQAQQDVWGEDPNTRMSSSANAPALANPTSSNGSRLRSTPPTSATSQSPAVSEVQPVTTARSEDAHAPSTTYPPPWRSK